MALFKVGDKVTIFRPKLHKQRFGFSSPMDGFLNRRVTISYVMQGAGDIPAGYHIAEGPFSWDERCFLQEDDVLPTKESAVLIKIKLMQQRRKDQGYVFLYW